MRSLDLQYLTSCYEARESPEVDTKPKSTRQAQPLPRHTQEPTYNFGHYRL